MYLALMLRARVDETYIEVKGEWKYGFVDIAALKVRYAN